MSDQPVMNSVDFRDALDILLGEEDHREAIGMVLEDVMEDTAPGLHIVSVDNEGTDLLVHLSNGDKFAVTVRKIF
jgi:hypothetical protein